MAVGGRVSKTRAAGWRGGARGRLGFDLQPLVSQGLGKVVVHRHADGELLGVSFLIIHPEAPLEMLLNHVLVVALRNHWNRRNT